MTYDDVSTRVFGTLQADSVIAGVDVAILNQDVLAAIKVKSVIVVVVVAEADGHTVEVKVSDDGERFFTKLPIHLVGQLRGTHTTLAFRRGAA